MLCTMLHYFIDLNLPIGWDELGVFVSAAAVIVALVANHKTTKSLNATIRIHEQSKNTELLKERLNTAERIRLGEEVPEMEFKVLFNDSICDAYGTYQLKRKEFEAAENDEHDFFSVWKDRLEPSEFDEMTTQFERYAQLTEESDCPEPTFNEYKEYCEAYRVPIQEPGTVNVYKYLAFDEIRDRISYTRKEFEATKKSLMKQIEDFLRASIAEIH